MRSLTPPDAARLGFMRPKRFQPFCTRNAAFLPNSRANPNSHPAMPQHPNNLQVTIDKLYGCAIMVSLSRHHSSVRRRNLEISDSCPVGNLGAPPAMLVRHAVPLTTPAADPRLCPATLLESTLMGMVQVFILNNLNLFRMNTYKNAHFWCNLSPFRINTCKSVSKQTTLSPFRMNTYKKHRGGGGSPQTANSLFTELLYLLNILYSPQKRQRPFRSDGGSCEKGAPSSGEKIATGQRLSCPAAEAEEAKSSEAEEAQSEIFRGGLAPRCSPRAPQTAKPPAPPAESLSACTS